MNEKYAKCAKCGAETKTLEKDLIGDSGFDAGQYADAQAFCSEECYDNYCGLLEESSELQNL